MKIQKNKTTGEKRIIAENIKDVKIKIEEQEKWKKLGMINQFILDDSKLPQRLNHALGFIDIKGKKYRYYGARIDERVEKIARNKNSKESYKYTTIQKSNAIILENGVILSVDSNKGINFEFDSIMTLKNNRWRLNSIRKFCLGGLRKQDYSFKKIYEKFKEKYDNSMVFDNQGWYKFNPIYDMTSYFWDLIDKFLFPKHEGITGSAKSKAMKISSNLSFNGKKFLCPTPANFFRYRHHNKATIMIEEAERLFDNSKRKSLGDSELIEYINGSYEKGNTVPRQNDKNINQTDEFDPAGFTRIGSIKSLKGALEKRSIPLNMIKAPKNDPRGNVEVPPENDKKYSEIRDMMYICGLLNYKKFQKSLGEIKNNYNLVNREWVISKPIIAMARCISEELEKEMGKFLFRLFNIRDDIIDEASWEIILTKCLVKIYCLRDSEQFVSVEDIKNKFLYELPNTEYKVSNTKIGILMSKLGFSDFKANPTGSQRGYKLSFFKVMEILIRQDWLSIENIKNIVSEVSGCKLTKEFIHKWYTDTLLTPYTFNKNNDENQGVSKNQKITHKSDTLTPLTPCIKGFNPLTNSESKVDVFQEKFKKETTLTTPKEQQELMKIQQKILSGEITTKQAKEILE